MSDARATARAAGSAEARFAQLYDLHHRALRDYCRRRLTADRVDDAVADIYLTAWRRLDDVPNGDAARLWLYRVVGHQWRGLDRRHRLSQRLGTVGNGSAPEPDELLIESEDRRLVLEAAAALGATDAEVLRLATWEQLPIAEIGTLLEIEPNAVKQRLHRARRNLADEFRRRSTQPDSTSRCSRKTDSPTSPEPSDRRS